MTTTETTMAVLATAENTAERTVVCTLTAPHDAAEIAAAHAGSAPPAQTWNSSKRGSRVLSGEALDAALAVLPQRGMLRFDMRETRFCDPLIPGQNLSLFSFVPASGARPDAKGVYGYGKIRGTFEADVDARMREETLIRDHDSYHDILTVRTGQPFPVVTAGDKYAAETNEVDVKKDMAESIAEDVKRKRQAERNEVEQIKRREEKLLQKSRRNVKDGTDGVQGASGAGGANEDDDDDDDEDSPLEKYTTLRMKKAQLIYTYRENKQKLDEVRNRLLDTVRDIAAIDVQTPEFKCRYKERIRKARTEAGMTTDFSDENFLRFVADDFDLSTIFLPSEIPTDLAVVASATSLAE